MAKDSEDSRRNRRVVPTTAVCLAVLFGAGTFTATSLAQTEFDPSSYLAKNYQTYASEQLQSTFDASQSETDSQANRHDSDSDSKKDSLSQIEADATNEASAYGNEGGEADSSVYGITEDEAAQTVIVADSDAGSTGTKAPAVNESGTVIGPIVNIDGDSDDKTGGGNTPGTNQDPTPTQPTYTKQTEPDYIKNGTYSDLDDTVTYQKDEDGNEVLSLAVSGSFPRAFYVGEDIDNESLYSGITVTATKRTSSGNTFIETIPYGDYSVSASTGISGSGFSAVFSYCGTSASLSYDVETTRVAIYGIQSTGNGYKALSLDSNSILLNGKFQAVTPYHQNNTGTSTLDLTAAFTQYLAWYAAGMPDEQTSTYDAATQTTTHAYTSSYTGLQPRIADSEGGTSGYLSTMAYGFVSDLSAVTTGPYSLTAAVSSNTETTNIYLALGSVPEGALLKLEATGIEPESLNSEVGNQVLVGCTSTKNGTFTVPDGTTKIALDECSGTTTVTNQITTLIIPSSVSSIDAKSLNTYATGLQSFEVSSDNATFSSQNWLLMDKEGTTVLAVPAGASTVALPKGATLSADALSGRTSNLTITLTEETPSDDLLASITAAARNTSATITIEVPDSTYDAVFKKYLAAWGPTLPSNVKLAVSGKADVAGYYKLSENGDGSIVRTSDESILSAVPWGATSYNATDITEIESAALCTAPNLSSLSFDSSLAQIDDYAFENDTTTYITLESTTAPTIGSKILGESADNIFISVPETSLNDYLSAWSSTLDEEYGSGTTKQVLGAQSSIATTNDGGIYRVKSDNTYELIAVLSTASGTFTVDPNTTSIAANAFDGCSGITSIVVQDGVTEIASGAFSGCENLEIITLPESIIDMASDALEGCTKLKAIGCNAKAAPSNSLKLSASSVSIFVPEGATGNYSSWSTAGTVSDTGTTYVLDSKVLYAQDSSDSNIGILAADSTISGTVTIASTVTSIADYAFANCTSLEEVDCSSATALTSIGEGAFSGCSSLASFNLGHCTALTHLGKEAFANCEKLDYESTYNKTTKEWFYSITIPDSVVVEASDTGWFKGCTKLTEIHFGDLTEIPADCCNGCSALKYGYLQTDVDITIGDRAFKDCTYLESSTLFKTNINITAIGEEAFSGCENLKLHNTGGTCLLPSTLTSIGANAFNDCTAIGIVRTGTYAALVLPDSLTTLDESAFANCTALKEITINNSLTSIGKYAFSNCTALSKVTLRDSGDGASSLKIIGVEAFKNCSSLTSIDLNSAMNLLALGNRAFQGCSALEYVILPKSLGASGSIGDNCFSECSALTKVYSTADEAPYIGSTIFGSSVDTEALTVYVSDSARSNYVNAWTAQLDGDYGDGTTEKLLSGTESGTIILDALGGTVEYRINSDGSYTLAKATGLTGDYEVLAETTSIASDAFAGCASTLTGISFANCETLTFGDRCFMGCKALKTVTFNCNVTEMGESVFENCDALTTVTLAKGYTIDRLGTRCFAGCITLTNMNSLAGTVTTIGKECFADCTSLTALSTTVSSTEFKTGLTTIEESAFSGCVKLTGLANTQNKANKYTALKSIGSKAFAGCKAITADYLPSGVTALSDSLYEGCTNLVSVMYYGNVTSIGNNCFKGCTKLAGVFTYYASGYSSLASIGDSAFEGCTAFGTQAKVGSYYYLFSLSNFTALESVGSRAFYGCTSLTSAAFASSSLSSIGSEAFYGCTGLTSASFTASLGSIGTDAFTGCSSLASMTFAGQTAPSIGGFDVSTLPDEFTVNCSAYGEDTTTNESIYNSYLEALTSALGSEDAATAVLAKPSTMTSGSSEDGASENDTTGANIASIASVEEEATVPESETSRTGETTEQGSTNNAAAGTEGGSGASSNENASDTAISSTSEANSASSSGTSNSTSSSNASTASGASEQTSTGTATESEGNSATESNTTASEN